ncbi:BREX-1 system adenine-specific DNA-methyltransferase PglX [Flavobacterium aquidurense]|uniref:BREX-1 system adenine-specific DNA-methyltransferase PglX n=1 Tax=Flavobacterium aquidurense TaxID=362413 RepID=UPI0037165EF9
MNTKTFAQQARRLLIDGVAKKLLYWGFDSEGNIIEPPQKVSGGYSFRGEVFDDPNVLRLWESLKIAVQQKTIEIVVEEAAYTWFNRIIALRIMAKNGYEPALLINAEGLEHTPVLLQKARQGQFSFLNTSEQERLKKIIGDYSKDQETFSILLVGYCHSNTMLNNVFGKIDDYTELLLPNNMLQDSGFLHLLNTTDAISDDEYQEVELIGWLYQFYISEKKDDIERLLKSKNQKIKTSDIPADTQIFTPNWIVKYMVQNTAGKIWLDKHPNSPLKTTMKYLVENESPNSPIASIIEGQVIKEVSELTLIDPAAGSGHILVEGFDLLYQMYLEEYYTPEEAVESILKNNLFGLDIDDRAAQLATFAILLKAAKYYRDVFTKGWLPNVYAMPEEKNFSLQEIKDFLGTNGVKYTEELVVALELMKQSKNLGSVMKLTLSEDAQTYISIRFNELNKTEFLDFNIESIFHDLKGYIRVLLILTNKYTALVANPPYMGQKKMNNELKGYLDKNYSNSKSDLMTVFIEMTPNMLSKNGILGIVTLDSWMFGVSYENLRKYLITNFNIETLIHIGWNAFPDGHTYNRGVSFTLRNENAFSTLGSFIDLSNVEATVNKEFLFHKRKNEKLFFYNKSSKDFALIPQTPIAFWAADKAYNAFKLKLIGDVFPVKKGMDTGGNNDSFLKFWFEVDLKNISYESKSHESFFNAKKKWAPYNKGGDYRKWYGNNLIIINWENSGKLVKESKSNIRSPQLFFSDGITWSAVSSRGFSARITRHGALFDSAGSSMFPDSTDKQNQMLALINSKPSTYFMAMINPTINFGSGTVSKIPYLDNDSIVINYSIQNQEISKRDWKNKELSWEFDKSPLLNESISLRSAYQKWQENATQDFFELHANEEELNRIFIDLYGLQEELKPNVALKDITILQEELNGKDLDKLDPLFRKNGNTAIALPINKNEVISQFISYSIGLFMGRFRLDKFGLNISNPNPTKEELESYNYKFGKVIIDEDAILPLMGKNCNFPDDALQQINQLLDTIWGQETRIENSNFIQECLGKELEKFLVKDFYKYHCSMYNKKPIYWLFSSKTSSFQVLVYMHRMNAFTVEKIRANYMLEHLKNLRSEESMLQANEANLNTIEAKRLDQIRKDLVECEAYDMELKNVADQQITFDLDEGVTANYAKFESVLAKIK